MCAASKCSSVTPPGFTSSSWHTEQYSATSRFCTSADKVPALSGVEGPAATRRGSVDARVRPDAICFVEAVWLDASLGATAEVALRAAGVVSAERTRLTLASTDPSTARGTLFI